METSKSALGLKECPSELGAGMQPRMYANLANFREMRERALRRRRSVPPKRRRIESKFLDSGPRGLIVHFGHESWNMVLNMMVGLRIAAARASLEPSRFVEPYDFQMREKFSILPRSSNVIRKMSRYNYVRRLCVQQFVPDGGALH